MILVQKITEIDLNQILEALKEFLKFSMRQLMKAVKWIENNPEKTVMILVAVSKAFSGNYTDLISVGHLMLG